MDKRVLLPLMLSLSHADSVSVGQPPRERHWRETQDADSRRAALEAAEQKRRRKARKIATQEVGDA